MQQDYKVTVRTTTERKFIVYANDYEEAEQLALELANDKEEGEIIEQDHEVVDTIPADESDLWAV